MKRNSGLTWIWEDGSTFILCHALLKNAISEGKHAKSVHGFFDLVLLAKSDILINRLKKSPMTKIVLFGSLHGNSIYTYLFSSSVVSAPCY